MKIKALIGLLESDKRKTSLFTDRMISVGTLEEKNRQDLAKKQNLANSIINVGEKWITELSNEELLDLFKFEE